MCLQDIDIPILYSYTFVKNKIEKIEIEVKRDYTCATDLAASTKLRPIVVNMYTNLVQNTIMDDKVIEWKQKWDGQMKRHYMPINLRMAMG